MPTVPFDPVSSKVPPPGQSASGLRFAVARTLDEVLEAWQLVYQSYFRDGLIDPNPHGLHTVRQAVGIRTAVMLGHDGNCVGGTLSAYGDSADFLPLDTVYHTEIQALRRAGRRLMEVGLFADRRDHLSRSSEGLFELMRFAYYFARHLPIDDVIIGVHPRHAPFYIRALAFEKIGPVRTYATVKDRPVVLLRFDMVRNPSLNPLPKGLQYILQNAIPTAVFEERFLFPADAVTASPIGRFLSLRRATHAA